MSDVFLSCSPHIEAGLFLLNFRVQQFGYLEPATVCPCFSLLSAGFWDRLLQSNAYTLGIQAWVLTIA